MCDRPINVVHPCNVNGNTYVRSRENILNNVQNALGEKKKPLCKSSTMFNIECNSHLNNISRTKDKILLHDLNHTVDDYLYRETWPPFSQNKSCRECNHKNIPQTVIDINVARQSSRSKLKKNRPKRRCDRRYRDVTVPIKRDRSETDNENFVNYLKNCSSKDTSKTKLCNLLIKDCPNCRLSASRSHNVSNNDFEAYANPNDYELDSCENCANYSYSSLIKEYVEPTIENFSYNSELQGCCCSRNTRENEIQDCTPSKASLFVETGESVIDFSGCSSSYSDAQNICGCSNESPMIEESLMTIENTACDRCCENEERVTFDECKIRCKSREHESGNACCSHFIPTERCYPDEKATWNQLETVESKAQRPDYERRENIQRRNASSSSTGRSIDKSPRCYESRTKCTRTDIKKESKENGIPRSCQSSLFGDFEIGKVWSQIHGVCKNLVQSAITNVGQAIKDMSRSKDTLRDCKENEISDSSTRNSSFDRTCPGSCRRMHGERQK